MSAPRRISVVGSSGSGKTTFAKKVAAAMGVEHVELDALHWGPDWTPAAPEAIKSALEIAMAAESWVVDGNYHGKIGTYVWDRADTIIWVHPGRFRALGQSIARTARRASKREHLWNGNFETWDGFKLWRGDESIIRWAWTSYPNIRSRMQAAQRDPKLAHIRFIELRSRAEADALIASLAKR